MRKMIVMRENAVGAEEIRAAIPDWEVVFCDDEEAAVPHLMDAEIIATWSGAQIERALAGGTLKWVQFFAAGVDSLPLEKLKEKGVYLTNASGVHGAPISETMFAMILAFARGIHSALADQKKRVWRRGHALTEIHEKTLGILGVGAIGLEAARIGKAFGMRVLGLRRGGTPAENVDEMYAPERADEMLEKCDYVMNVLPWTSETEHFMNAVRFSRMKKTACYVSAGRGATTDQEALIEALRTGQIASAGLDVTVPEPLPADSPLWDMDNVILTPHMAGLTDRYFERAMEILLENLRAYINAGAPVKNVVDYDLQY